MGGKVLVSMQEHCDRLVAARLQADIMGTEVSQEPLLLQAAPLKIKPLSSDKTAQSNGNLADTARSIYKMKWGENEVKCFGDAANTDATYNRRPRRKPLTARPRTTWYLVVY